MEKTGHTKRFIKDTEQGKKRRHIIKRKVGKRLHRGKKRKWMKSAPPSLTSPKATFQICITEHSTCCTLPYSSHFQIMLISSLSIYIFVI